MHKFYPVDKGIYQRHNDRISPGGEGEGGGNFKNFGPFEILVTPVFLLFFFYHEFTKIIEWGIHHFKYNTSTKLEFTKYM